MTIDLKTQAKIDELRRLAALPPPEPADRFTRRIMEAFFRGMQREADLELVMRDFAGIELPTAD